MLVLGFRLLGGERAAERASFCSAVEQKNVFRTSRMEGKPRMSLIIILLI